MIIHCPNCKTQFNVDLNGIGQNGRVVRCFNCTHEWFQKPVASSVIALQHPPQFSGYPPQYPPQNYPNPGYPYPPPGYPRQPAPPQTPVDIPTPKPEMVPEPENPGPGDAELENVLSDNINALFESDDDEEDDFDIPPPVADVTEPEPEPEPVKIEDDISDEELDDIFDGEDEPDVISSITNPTSEDDEQESPIDIDDINDIPDPDPLPDSLTSDLSDEPEIPRKRRRGKKAPAPMKKSKATVYIILAVIIAAILGGLYFLRPLVLQYVPSLGTVYDSVGISSHELGDGLAIEDINYQRVTNGGIDFLIVTGNITNLSSSDVDVPLIQAVLSNADGDHIQTVVQEPPETSIAPQNMISFKIEVEEPSPLARRVNVSFAPRPNSEAGEGTSHD